MINKFPNISLTTQIFRWKKQRIMQFHILVDTCTCMRFCNWFGQFYIQIQTLIESDSKHSLNSPHRQRSNIIKIVCKKMLSHFQFIG